MTIVFDDIVLRSICPVSSLGNADWGREGWEQVNRIHDVLGVPYEDLVPEQFSLELDGFTLKDKYDFNEKKFVKTPDSEITMSFKVTDPQLMKKLQELSRERFTVTITLEVEKE